MGVLDRFASPLAVRPKEASDGFHTIGDVMPLTASAHAHAVACASTRVIYPASAIQASVMRYIFVSVCCMTIVSFSHL